MSGQERPLRGIYVEFPRGRNKGAHAILEEMKVTNRMSYRAVLGITNGLIKHYVEEDSPADAETGLGILGSFEEQTRIIGRQVFPDQSVTRFLDRLSHQAHKLRTHFMNAGKIEDFDFLEAAVVNTTISTEPRMGSLEKHAIYDLSIGVGLGNREVTVRMAKKFFRDFDKLTKLTPGSERREISDIELGNDFIHFLLVSDLDYPDIAEGARRRELAE